MYVYVYTYVNTFMYCTLYKHMMQVCTCIYTFTYRRYDQTGLCTKHVGVSAGSCPSIFEQHWAQLVDCTRTRATCFPAPLPSQKNGASEPRPGGPSSVLWVCMLGVLGLCPEDFTVDRDGCRCSYALQK